MKSNASDFKGSPDCCEGPLVGRELPAKGRAGLAICRRLTHLDAGQKLDNQELSRALPGCADRIHARTRSDKGVVRDELSNDHAGKSTGRAE